MHILIAIVTAVLMLAGLAGSVVPVIPGPLLVLAGALLYAWHGDFLVVSWATIGVLAGFTLLSQLLDYVASLIGAKKYGASRWGIAGAFVGGIVGLFVGGVFGIILGPFVGAIAFELLHGRSVHASVKIGFGTLIGFLAGAAGKVVITLIMTGLFIVQFF